MTEKQQRKYWQMFCDGWKLFKMFRDPKGTDDFWKELHDHALELDKKYNNPLMRAIVVAIMEELHEIYQQEK